MNIDTGEILTLDEVKKKPLKEQKRFVEIPNHLLKDLQGMNRAQRRKYYKKHKSEFKKAGLNICDV